MYVSTHERLPASRAGLPHWLDKRISNARRPLEALNEHIDQAYEAYRSVEGLEYSVRWSRYGCQYAYSDKIEKIESVRLDNAALLEPFAGIILRSCDDIISDLGVLLTGHPQTIPDGPMLRESLYVSSVLRACGNYLRHVEEWRTVWNACHAFEPRQLESIVPLTLALGDEEGSSNKEKLIGALLAEQTPMLRILDTLTAYDAELGKGDYSKLEDVVRGVGGALIARYSDLYERRLGILLKRKRIDAVTAQWLDDLCSVAFESFIDLAETTMQEHLHPAVTIEKIGRASDGMVEWRNGICYARIALVSGFAVEVSCGEITEQYLDFRNDGYYGPDENLFGFSLEPESAREVGTSDLAHWMNCDTHDAEGYPVPRERVMRENKSPRDRERE